MRGKVLMACFIVFLLIAQIKTFSTAGVAESLYKPGIDYILTNYMCYGDLGTYEQLQILIPGLDRMLEEEMSLTQPTLVERYVLPQKAV